MGNYYITTTKHMTQKHLACNLIEHQREIMHCANIQYVVDLSPQCLKGLACWLAAMGVTL